MLPTPTSKDATVGHLSCRLGPMAMLSIARKPPNVLPTAEQCVMNVSSSRDVIDCRRPDKCRRNVLRLRSGRHFYLKKKRRSHKLDHALLKVRGLVGFQQNPPELITSGTTL